MLDAEFGEQWPSVDPRMHLHIQQVSARVQHIVLAEEMRVNGQPGALAPAGRRHREVLVSEEVDTQDSTAKKQ